MSGVQEVQEATPISMAATVSMPVAAAAVAWPSSLLTWLHLARLKQSLSAIAHLQLGRAEHLVSGLIFPQLVATAEPMLPSTWEAVATELVEWVPAVMSIDEADKAVLVITQPRQIAEVEAAVQLLLPMG
tara:strand:+ start:437 stop:826 length:390 start_codon:yes stop_codon:yes gene_type:complete